MFRVLVDQSKHLREEPTPQEEALWSVLRQRQSVGAKFRRQYPISPYIVDFCCPSKKVIVELDGFHHSQKAYKTYDRKRIHYLEERGYLVLRFWNGEIDRNLKEVLKMIAYAVRRRHWSAAASPSSRPSPQREKEI